MKRSIGTLCLAMICAGPPALCAQEVSGGVSAVTVSVGADEASSFGIGMIGLINTTSPWPVFPMLVYRHRFDKRWSMEIMPPQFRLTCAVNPSNRITATASMSRPAIRSCRRPVCTAKSLMRPELKLNKVHSIAPSNRDQVNFVPDMGRRKCCSL